MKKDECCIIKCEACGNMIKIYSDSEFKKAEVISKFGWYKIGDNIYCCNICDVSVR